MWQEVCETTAYNTHRSVGYITAGFQLCMLGITVNHHPLEVKLHGHRQTIDEQIDLKKIKLGLHTLQYRIFYIKLFYMQVKTHIDWHTVI